ncbi:MAG: hypothetical protein ACREJ9_15500 [Candidatus Rokuibacteriota bacterium]
MRRRGAVLVAAIGLWPAVGWSHEERLLVGRVEQVEPARRLLVVVDTQRGERRRLEVNQETEVLICRPGADLAALGPGGLVRVKYVDRAGAEPEVRSILLLRPGR